MIPPEGFSLRRRVIKSWEGFGKIEISFWDISFIPAYIYRMVNLLNHKGNH
jgi:hypothetical protein